MPNAIRSIVLSLILSLPNVGFADPLFCGTVLMAKTLRLAADVTKNMDVRKKAFHSLVFNLLHQQDSLQTVTEFSKIHEANLFDDSDWQDLLSSMQAAWDSLPYQSGRAEFSDRLGQLFLTSAKFGSLGSMRVLADRYGVDVNFQDLRSDGYTALMFATSLRSRDMLKWLLSQPRIDTSLTDSNGNTALFFILPSLLLEPIESEASFDEILTEYLLHPKVNFNAKNNAGKNLLHVAVSGHGIFYSLDPSDFELLLNKADKLDVNALDSYKKGEGQTPLARAISAKRKDAIVALSQHPQIQINKRMQHLETALFEAVAVGDLSLLEFLLNLPEIEVGVVNSSGHNLLFLAASLGHEDIAARLLRLPEMVAARDIAKNAITEALFQAEQQSVPATAQRYRRIAERIRRSLAPGSNWPSALSGMMAPTDKSER